MADGHEQIAAVGRKNVCISSPPKRIAPQTVTNLSNAEISVSTSKTNDVFLSFGNPYELIKLENEPQLHFSNHRCRVNSTYMSTRAVAHT